MVDDEVRDGSRIARLLSSEVHGHERGTLGDLSVVDADRDAEPTEGGTFAYAVEYEPRGTGDGAEGVGDRVGTDGPGEQDATRVAEVYLHPDRIRVEFAAEPETARGSAAVEGLPVSPANTGEPAAEAGDTRASLFVESGAAVKPASRVLRAVAESLREELGEV